MRTRFAATTERLLDDDRRIAVVLAEISADLFAEAQARYPERVINVGIREQLMMGVAGGLALTGLRPIAYSLGDVALLDNVGRPDGVRAGAPGRGGHAAYGTIQDHDRLHGLDPASLRQRISEFLPP